MGQPPDKHQSPDRGDLEEGTRLLDRYSILDRVGSGGMATIYRALDERLERVVCVKLLRSVVEDGESGAGTGVYQATYSHFLQEALALSKLQHPNTLRIFDFGYLPNTSDGRGGEQEGQPFQISEYLDGGNLDTRVRRSGALPREEVGRIMDRISGAVAEAHERRIIHRDIKPSNILFARIGDSLVPKLADFGIARTELKKKGAKSRNDDDDNAKASTVTLFSPRWAAPEQLCGGDEGPYTDVYALGLLTVYMLTGRAPFDDKDVRATFTSRVESMELIERRMRERHLDGPLLDVLMATLTANPANRIQSAVELFERLRPALAPAVGVVPVMSPQAPTFSPAPPRPPLHTPTPTPGGGPPLSQLRAVSAPASNVPLGPLVLRSDAPGARERVHQVGRCRVRVIDVHEGLDFSRVTAHQSSGGAPMEMRFRVTMLPAHNAPLRINVKGLSCFVAWSDRSNRPSPALLASQDGAMDLISSTREALGRVSWSFGTRAHVGHSFVVDGEEMVIPYQDATHAVVLHLGDDREYVAMCRRV